MSDYDIIIEKLAEPRRGTGHHLWHYVAYYEDDPEVCEYGQTGNEAVQTLKHRRPR